MHVLKQVGLLAFGCAVCVGGLLLTSSLCRGVIKVLLRDSYRQHAQQPMHLPAILCDTPNPASCVAQNLFCRVS